MTKMKNGRSKEKRKDREQRRERRGKKERGGEKEGTGGEGVRASNEAHTGLYTLYMSALLHVVARHLLLKNVLISGALKRVREEKTAYDCKMLRAYQTSVLLFFFLQDKL